VSWLLDAVPRNERERVQSALAACATLTLPAGSQLGPDRIEADSLLLIEDGIAFVSAPSAAQRRMVVAFAASGSVLLAPAADERLEALADLRVTLVTTATRRQLLQVPAAAAVILDGIAGGLRDCQESLSHFASLRPVDRVRHKLLQLARAYGKVVTGGVSLSLPLTHELLADMVGSTRETVTRTLSQLAHEGLLRHERGRFQLAALPDGFVSSSPSESMIEQGSSSVRQFGVSHLTPSARAPRMPRSTRPAHMP
jgi:CRP/FNR family cyclic AMP-dependent transcriptional regulator